MRGLSLSLAALLTAALLGQPLAARVVDYSVDDSVIVQEATELKIASITPGLTLENHTINVTIAPGVDHITDALGIYCSVYKVENPISQLVKKLAVAAANDKAAASININLTGARSYRRCVEVKEMNARCIIRVVLTGTVAGAGAGSIPISGDVERDSSVSGICGSLARGIRVVSREAAIMFLKDAEKKLPVSSNP
jgi:hypothetical protein